jgi:hypothetical protein
MFEERVPLQEGTDMLTEGGENMRPAGRGHRVMRELPVSAER